MLNGPLLHPNNSLTGTAGCCLLVLVKGSVAHNIYVRKYFQRLNRFQWGICDSWCNQSAVSSKTQSVWRVRLPDPLAKCRNQIWFWIWGQSTQLWQNREVSLNIVILHGTVWNCTHLIGSLCDVWCRWSKLSCSIQPVVLHLSGFVLRLTC